MSRPFKVFDHVWLLFGCVSAVSLPDVVSDFSLADREMVVRLGFGSATSSPNWANLGESAPLAGRVWVVANLGSDFGRP